MGKKKKDRQTPVAASLNIHLHHLKATQAEPKSTQSQPQTPSPHTQPSLRIKPQPRLELGDKALPPIALRAPLQLLHQVLVVRRLAVGAQEARRQRVGALVAVVEQRVEGVEVAGFVGGGCCGGGRGGGRRGDGRLLPLVQRGLEGQRRPQRVDGPERRDARVVPGDGGGLRGCVGG